MRVIRGFVDAELCLEREITLGAELANHLTRVLRLRSGDAVHLFNGDGREFSAVLTSLERKRTLARIESEITPIAESSLHLTLAQGLCRGEKMDLVLQKATELGIAALQPLITERTEVRLDAERESRRMLHWRSVLASACEQSGRATLPSLAAPIAFANWMAQNSQLADPPLALLLDPEGDVSLRDLPRSNQIVLAVGPEGGFSEAERTLMLRLGFVGMRFGPRIMRTETAGLAALAALQSHWGDC